MNGNPTRPEFRRKGHAVGVHAISPGELAMLRRVCDTPLDDGPVDDVGGRHRTEPGKDHRFLAHSHADLPDLERFRLSGAAARIAAGLPGPECMLFNEQFAVKGTGHGAGFSRHRDIAHVGFDHDPHLSFRISPHDMTARNGCLRIPERDLDRDGRVDPHVRVERNRELNGRFGEEARIAVGCTAGPAVVFSSLTFHTSGPNTIGRRPRADLAQCRSAPLRDPGTGGLTRFARNVSGGGE